MMQSEKEWTIKSDRFTPRLGQTAWLLLREKESVYANEKSSIVFLGPTRPSPL